MTMKLCGALKPTHALQRYAWGDPLPHNALFTSEGDEPVFSEERPIQIYIACQREKGHPGKHLSLDYRKGWIDADL